MLLVTKDPLAVLETNKNIYIYRFGQARGRRVMVILCWFPPRMNDRTS
jgi:hypothetical protein